MKPDPVYNDMIKEKKNGYSYDSMLDRYECGMCFVTTKFESSMWKHLEEKHKIVNYEIELIKVE